MIASVIVDIQNKQVNRSFDYIVPQYLANVLKVGYRVKVPFGPRSILGYVIQIKDITDFSGHLKEIVDLVDVYPPLNEEFIELAKNIAENNFSFYASALQTMIPTALKVKYEKIAVVKNKELLPDELKVLFKRDSIKLDSLNKEQQKLIYLEVSRNNIVLETKFKKTRNEQKNTYVFVKDDSIIPQSRQGKELLSYLIELNMPIEINALVNDSGYSKGIVQTLIKNNILGTYEEEDIELDYKFEAVDKKVIFNQEQQQAYDSINLNSNQTYLIHGVTGSGKTEIYLRLMEDAIRSNKTALMLVPEISLTPQITAILGARFKSDIAILHSRLSIVEKYNAWKKIYDGEIKLVVGARSAIFAPLKNIGVIIIDEEHERTYVQDNNPKYDAIEIARLRSKTHNCPVILGSATPSICDYHKAISGEYELISLKTRANNKPLPNVEVVSLVDELKSGNKSVFSRKLKDAVISNYKKGDQSILFLNRRGYSSFVMCRSCGEVVKCINCDISLTYHANTQTLKCHYCGYQINNVLRCANCGSDKIRYVGSGTQKIEEELQSFIPEAKVIRLDYDTTRGKGDYEKAYKAFKNKEADILVGTQMITKGLDFENVTLVGIINADLALHYPSYDATVEAFNLLEQVSGRAGRDKKDGRVIIQTYNPNHYVIKCVKAHDYDSFYNIEIAKRQITLMPPFSLMYEIMVSSENKQEAYKASKTIYTILAKDKNSSIVLGPNEHSLFKKNSLYRYVIQVQAMDENIIDKIKNIYPTYQADKEVRLSITRM